MYQNFKYVIPFTCQLYFWDWILKEIRLYTYTQVMDIYYVLYIIYNWPTYIFWYMYLCVYVALLYVIDIRWPIVCYIYRLHAYRHTYTHMHICLTYFYVYVCNMFVKHLKYNKSVLRILIYVTCLHMLRIFIIALSYQKTGNSLKSH